MLMMSPGVNVCVTHNDQHLSTLPYFIGIKDAIFTFLTERGSPLHRARRNQMSSDISRFRVDALDMVNTGERREEKTTEI